MDPHALAQARSLAAHRLITARLDTESELVMQARERLEAWAQQGKMHPHYAERWRELLTGVKTRRPCSSRRSWGRRRG